MSTNAAELAVSPIRVFIYYGDHSATLSITNQGAQPARLQLTGFAWTQNPDGSMHLVPSDDLVFFPTLVDLGPLASQVVRIGYTGPPPVDREYSFRIFIQELPTFNGPNANGGVPAVTVRTRLGIPIFIEPSTPVRDLDVDSVGVSGTKLSFSVSNSGNAYSIVRHMLVEGDADNGERLFEKSVNGWYVLPGEHENYSTQIPKDLCSRLGSLRFSLIDERGTVTRVVPRSRTVCD